MGTPPAPSAGPVVHLVDGTYELFRYHFARNNRDPHRGAVRGVIRSVLGMVRSGATHVGVATDHVIESFRNDLWPGYKTSAGVPPELLAQFEPLEVALAAFGFVVWPMVELEADDALAAAARVADADPGAGMVVICTPDKDLAQCVRDRRVLQWDRRRDIWRDEDGVREKFGVSPPSIPDWLALVGDSADGLPGIPGFGARTAAVVLSRWGHIEDIPLDPAAWDVPVRGARTLAATLAQHLEEALLFRRLATLEADTDLGFVVDDLRWRGPTDRAAEVAAELGAPALAEEADELAGRTGGS